MRTSILVYDSDCGLCTRFRQTIELLDAGDRFRFVQMRDAEADGLLGAVPSMRRGRSFHLIRLDETVVSGARAIPYLVGQLPAGRFVAKAMVAVPEAARATAFLYSIFVRVHDANSCGFKTG